MAEQDFEPSHSDMMEAIRQFMLCSITGICMEQKTQRTQAHADEDDNDGQAEMESYRGDTVDRSADEDVEETDDEDDDMAIGED